MQKQYVELMSPPFPPHLSLRIFYLPAQVA